MLILPGGPVLSAFRCQQLLSHLQKQLPQLAEISTQSLYFVKTDGELDSVTLVRLADMLQAEPEPFVASTVGLMISVVPRAGTITPWSSKASDIVHRSGLSMIERVEHGRCYYLHGIETLTDSQWQVICAKLHDRMIECCLPDIEQTQTLFAKSAKRPLNTIPILDEGSQALAAANKSQGWALSDEEINYLSNYYLEAKRDPSDAELMMFAQVNSEHCRHKIFNADWIIDGEKQEKSLFSMIRNTHSEHPEGVISAYSDNAAVITGFKAKRQLVDATTNHYQQIEEEHAIVIKVETHNHPTAISPYPGAATGAGGEIRDEGATGCGAYPKAGLVGFSVSDLLITDFKQPWEQDFGKPENIASAFNIMQEAPIGSARFNNEFGRPNLAGFFRTLSARHNDTLYGYHKPIMIAGGYGTIRPMHQLKKQFTAGTPLVILGGPAMLIGLGGGAASSMQAGSSHAELDFASVQRENPEMQRRCQSVIDACNALGEATPIISIHDVGAGGISNALPEIVHDNELGAEIQLREILLDDPSLSPAEIWCNESQERYVLAIDADKLEQFLTIAERERAPAAVVGFATADAQLKVADQYFNKPAVDLPMSTLFANPPKLCRKVKTPNTPVSHDFNYLSEDLETAAMRVLQLPCVASKQFLITIGDRSVGGMVVRDQMVGPWQIPVADAAITTSSFSGYCGEAMAMGERAPIAMLSPAASGRMAVGEAITNLVSVHLRQLGDIKLSANWMSAAGTGDEDYALHSTVKAVGMELCPALGIAIPVGKDSLSMQTRWQQDDQEQRMQAPLSLIISAFTPVEDVRQHLTPQLEQDLDSVLMFVDIAAGKKRLGGSALAQVYDHWGGVPPDIDNPNYLKDFFNAIKALHEKKLMQAYHDRSDGGLWATLTEMSFAGACGIDIDLTLLGDDAWAALFNEELGAVIQVRAIDVEAVKEIFGNTSLSNHLFQIGSLNNDDIIRVKQSDTILLEKSRADWQSIWAETSFRMQALRDNPICAQQEFMNIQQQNTGLQAELTFSPEKTRDKLASFIHVGALPQVAILREQGINGHREMAAAFERAGFLAVDVHMQDILSGQCDLSAFKGLAFCGGFSFGDVLGAGRGWAQSISQHADIITLFQNFFERTDTFSLGICNGCQMLSQLKEIIPGATHWPNFISNTSEQYEARLCQVRIPNNNSIFFSDMVGSSIPVVVAHGEGRAQFADDNSKQALINSNCIAMQYVDSDFQATEVYPANPNGSPNGIAGLTTEDGRVTICMPHPERLFRTVQFSWAPKNWGEDSPWLRMFVNARTWVG